MTHLEDLKESARQQIGHLLPSSIFDEFDQLNSRMLIAVTCMQRGLKGLAYPLFQSIAEQGPSENENLHFAYVRSLVEMAEMDAEQEDFAQAEKKMDTALQEFPESMGYMMSRIHLEVYLTYYRFRLGQKETAYAGLEEIIRQEEQRFRELGPEDGRNLAGPGLSYAIHQLALFYGEDGNWQQAVETFRRLRETVAEVDEIAWGQGERLAEAGRYEEAFQQLEASVSYQAG
ncbi:tetratricopeptide (TPR) repeat protein [Kroppenstedtia sanguinis]|uniref:Tetratricopeptide repeat protein n=1 Tax=Kroppenstedtia sanguinis TaxID=1380684 RepID=A0ABW4CAD8_9BACL